jgi:hypothetical protein
MSVVVLPSPLVGPVAYAPLAHELGAAVAALRSAPRTAADALEGFVAGATAAEVLVAHSNAGLYAGTVARRVGAGSVVYVDAGLPAFAGGPTPIAPPVLLEHLRDLADDTGTLPRWSDWWPAEEVAGLFPDAEWADRVRAEEPRLSLGYLEDTLVTDPGWADVPSGYLAFGTTYATELARATAAGWPTRTLAGEHLHLLLRPVEVAEAIRAVLSVLG